ncbi:hydroxylamine reductase [Hydrogenispora ethanolica]|uniref:Hydroxylamine reductase n=1 Tax=Hydrogenispora ethanolica TaxID=1082276 RepID=A0A4V2QCW9_HYDET|nr:hydroxylamine reductase [Hydrogenispora ethanolica]TCL61477.1 hydroxylamine reductase [Hydrogenispora ethanolica]
MFCYQCEQAAQGTGCTAAGVCGKDHDTAALQDLLFHAAQGIAQYEWRARQLGAVDRETDRFILKALFTTVTNVNFDPERLRGLLMKAAEFKEKAKKLYETACAQAGRQAESPTGPAEWKPAADLPGLIEQGESYSIEHDRNRHGHDLSGLKSLAVTGLKGMAAYAEHAQDLGVEDDKVYAFFEETLDFLTREKFSVDELLGRSLKIGEINLRVMEMLDEANTTAFGHPVPTPVRITPVKGKAILISGHDLKDLEELLKQTAGKGVNVYTHGEMIPAHGYPKLKQYPHLVGNYGGAWQAQREEFEKFPGAILMTTNCIQKPKNSYQGRIFTSGLVAWPGVTHIQNRDFAPVIQAALREPGFDHDEPEKTIMVGFARNAVLGVAGKIVDMVKRKAIRHFFLVGGCDGAKPGRDYYTQFAMQVPKDCVILTLACGKYRFNKLDFGSIEGIPRLLDIGQCNDAYSAIKIAVALAEAFQVDVNDLPLSLVLSWYEQKAICILLTLLHLGIKNIRIGPSLPAFITPAAYQVLKEKFNLLPITTPERDLAEILGTVPAGT